MKEKYTKSGLRMENVLFSKNKEQVKSIYFEAFPKHERMPFPLMMMLSCMPTTKYLAFYDGDKLCGFVYFGKIFRQIFILFFAVDNKQRSNGYGSRILNDFKDIYHKCSVIVTIEPCDNTSPDPVLCKRRKGFYERNGYSDTGYSIKLTGMMQEILISGGKFNRFLFSVFLVVYSCCGIIPRIKKRQ